jgi:uncharacterized protein (DUF302 family)
MIKHISTTVTVAILIAGVVVPTAEAQQPAAGGASSAIVTTASNAPFDSTLSRLERAITAKGLTIAARVDHAAAASRAGLTLRPTTLVIAGNPAAGTPLMLADQTMGVELPLRFLVWQGEDGKARVSYDPIKSIAARHKIAGRDELLGRMTAAIESIVAEAVR